MPQSLSPADSLLKILGSAKNDSVKARIYSLLTEVCEINDIKLYADEVIKISDKYLNSTNPNIKNKFLGYKAAAISNMAFVADAEGDVDKCIQLYKEALSIREVIKDTNAIGNTLYNLASLYKSTGKLDEALALTQKALVYLSLKKNKLGMANCYFSIGEIYLKRGKIIESIEYLEKCLKINQEINNQSGIASALTGLGTIQGELGDTKKELEYLTECLIIQKKIDDKFGLAFTYNNLGYVYFVAKDFQKAKEFYEKSLHYAESIDEWNSIALAYHNIGNVYYELGNKKTANEFYLKSISIREKIKDDGGKALTLINIGKIAYYSGKSVEAKKYLEEAYQTGVRLKYSDVIRKSSEIMNLVYADEGNYKAAYNMHKTFKQLSDSLFNKENKRASFKQQIKLEFDKKETESKLIARIEKEKIQALANEEKRRQQVIIYAVSFVLILVFLLTLFILKGYKQKQKANIALEEKNVLIESQKKEVELQKEIVEEKHKEIKDSINYAERIQRSFLASEDQLSQNLKEHFVFFQPKDIVSGDFYWAGKLNNGNFALVTADSTGHGVPGAIMSILNISSLEKAVEQGLCEPSEILNHTRKTIIVRLKKDGSVEGGKDGMDCSLICFDFKSSKLIYSAANNPVWVVRSGGSSEVENKLELIELVPDKMPVGKHDKDSISFSQREFHFQQGDIIYTLTDGMPDQFGGPKGKKFMYKRLKEFLISVSQLPMLEQKEKLKETLNIWKADLEQVDDVCVIGIRV